MEWCLSATQPPDQCIHLYTNVRNNGTDIRLEATNITEIAFTSIYIKFT